MTDNVIDIITKKKVAPDVPGDATNNQWFDLWKRYAKQEKLETFIIIAAADDGSIRYELRGVNEQHLNRLYRECDRMKALIEETLNYEEDGSDPVIDVDLEDE